MPQYRASKPIYLSNERRMIAEGEAFASDECPGHAWIPLETAPSPAIPPARRAATGSRK